jgi:GAF domain-containing protein
MSDERASSAEMPFGELTPLVTVDADLESALRRVALAGCAYVPNCVAASITIVKGRRAISAGATDRIALELDSAQYEADDGPCLAAVRDDRVVVIGDIRNETRWPAFVEAAARHRVRSTLSLPIPLAGDHLRAGFNLHSGIADAFGDAEQAAGRSFAMHASVIVSNAHAYWAALEMSRNLSQALESRPVIDQAKGILMSRHGITAADAFEVLRRRSQDENRKLRDVAQELVDSTGAEDA